MSTASRSNRSSISVRISWVHGSAAEDGVRSDEARESSPAGRTRPRWRAGMTASTMITSGRRSVMSCTCFSVCPPDIGITVQPSFSAP
jgi:hypothetical protein